MYTTNNTTSFEIIDTSVEIERTEALTEEINHFSELVASLNLSADDNNDLVQAAARLLSEAEKSGFAFGIRACIETSCDRKQ